MVNHTTYCATLGCVEIAVTFTCGLPSCGHCAELPTCDVDDCGVYVSAPGELCPVCQEIEADTL